MSMQLSYLGMKVEEDIADNNLSPLKSYLKIYMYCTCILTPVIPSLKSDILNENTAKLIFHYIKW